MNWNILPVINRIWCISLIFNWTNLCYLFRFSNNIRLYKMSEKY